MTKRMLTLLTALAISGVFLVLAFLVLRTSPVVSAASGGNRSDFALLDQEPTSRDVSVQCGATSSNPVAFVMHITMTNRGDLGGTAGFVRVTYHDSDFVDYAIPANTTVQISLAGGGTPGVDDAIKVNQGNSGAVLVGQASIEVPAAGQPLLLISSTSLCTTTPQGSSSPF